MKKTILFMLVAIAICANGATVKWNWLSSAGIKFGDTSVKAAGTAYLLYIGSDTVSTYSLADYVGFAENTTTPKYVATAATNMSKISVKPVTIDANAGNYVSLVSYVDGGKTYWNMSGTVYNLTQAGIDDLLSNGVALPDSSFVFSSTVNETGDTKTGSVGGGWYAAAAVPEPATGALALAGIALLLKRRKAAKA